MIDNLDAMAKAFVEEDARKKAAAAAAAGQPAGGAPPAAAPPAAAPPQQSAADEYTSNLHKGKEVGDGLLADGTIGLLKEGRDGEVSDYLAKLNARTAGMNSAEQLAAREQSLTEINRGTQGNMRQMRAMQGAQGVRGGAAIAGQRQILNSGEQAKADFERKLTQDNIQQQNNAFAMYGNALSGARGEELKRETSNLNIKNALPFEISSGIDAVSTGRKQDTATDRMIDVLSKGALGGGGAAAPSPEVTEKVEAQQAALPASQTTDPGEKLKKTALESLSSWEKDPKAYDAALEEYHKYVYNTIAQQNPDMAPDQIRRESDQQLRSEGLNLHPGQTVLCSAAHDLGFIDQFTLQNSRTYGRRKLTSKEYRGYLMWATPVAAAMRKHTWLAAILWSGLRFAIAEQCFQVGATPRGSLIGRVLLAGVKAYSRWTYRRSRNQGARIHAQSV